MPLPFNVDIGTLADDTLRDRWLKLEAASRTRSPFTNWDHQAALQDAYGLRAHVLIADENGADLAGAILFRRRRLITLVDVPPLTPYSALLVRDDGEDRDSDPLSAILEAIAATTDVVHLEIPPSLEKGVPLTPIGYSCIPRATYTVSLKGDSDMLDEWSAGARRTARRHDAGYSFGWENQSGKELIDLAAASYERNGRSLPGGSSAALALLERAIAGGRASIAMLRDEEDQAAAAVAVARSGPDTYYWIAGSHPGPAMTVLLARTFSALRRDGVETFDYIGANVPSIAEFKRRRAGQLVPYRRCTRIRGRWVRPLLFMMGRPWRRLRPSASEN
jgi:hypothetical protein